MIAFDALYWRHRIQVTRTSIFNGQPITVRPNSRRIIVLIKAIILTPGTAAFFYDDQAAIRSGAGHNGFLYVGEPLTPRFKSIRVPRIVSVSALCGRCNCLGRHDGRAVLRCGRA
ncbi:hypothetical protein [Mesorhizobium sp. M0800]|uniref:hypothetical protein n=1 Tax=Mesorhizobium sp. M0800 TaxID=2957000 RepID=UPI0033361C93